ncbi:ParB/RepB/Spo0J family partition protein [Rickettsiales bacterium]|nr:ParB/RepB/Spo0J family partition protein [Rickettsiales bacterium]
MSGNVLGKGLSALIGDIDNSAPKAVGNKKNKVVANQDVKDDDNRLKAVYLDVTNLTPGEFQPRSHFNDEALAELADSIKQNGVLQPIIVRPQADGKYQIIAGERRWRACKLLKKDEIPAIVKDFDDKTALEVALIENIQRQSLSPIEEAEGYQRLLSEFSYTQAQLSKGLGKSRSHIANMLRLTQLPKDVKNLVEEGKLTMGHARALVNQEDASNIALEIVEKGLSVREAEKFAAKYGTYSTKEKPAKDSEPAAENTTKIVKTQKSPQKSANNNKADAEKDEDLIALEIALSNNLGLKVNVEDSDEGGRVSVFFNNLSELDIILQRLGA